ncbi:ABC transporter permease [Candidatus Poriferisodalis sp.]|uniref:ABC transporter permease n=1 Tax=Candidatus Poriferisodalis sp. TaxID=3101277 RepID=UPI003B019694
MARYIGIRLLAMIPLLFAIAVISFAIAVAMEARGSIAGSVCGEGATIECIAQVERQLGLDDPMPIRFVRWLASAVTGDLGTSLTNESVTVWSLIADRIGPTLSIVGYSLVIGVAAGMAMGIVSGVKPGGGADRALSVASAALIAAPGFVLAMLLSWWLAVKWGWLSPAGYTRPSESITGWLGSITLPAIGLALPTVALVQRQLRSSMSNALQSRYVLAARARGVGRMSLIGEHALPNAMIPTVTAIGFRAAAALGLTFTVEVVFNINGMGTLLTNAIQTRNVTVLQGSMLVVGIVVLVVNLLVDISYGLLNPKVRLER